MNSVLFEFAANNADEVAQFDIDGGEVATAVNRNDVTHEVVKSLDLFVGEDAKPLVLLVRDLHLRHPAAATMLRIHLGQVFLQQGLLNAQMSAL